jgi:hypothetical protein
MLLRSSTVALLASAITIATGSAARAQDPPNDPAAFARAEPAPSPPPEVSREGKSLVWKERWGRAHPYSNGPEVGVQAAGAF